MPELPEPDGGGGALSSLEGAELDGGRWSWAESDEEEDDGGGGP